MGLDAVAIGAIVSLVLTIVVIGVIAYKVVKIMEDSSNDNLQSDESKKADFVGFFCTSKAKLVNAYIIWRGIIPSDKLPVRYKLCRNN